MSARFAPWALCEDTGGSCRAPAIANGIFGLRPTLGCYNYSDALVLATFTRDTVGKLLVSFSYSFPSSCIFLLFLFLLLLLLLLFLPPALPFPLLLLPIIALRGSSACHMFLLWLWSLFLSCPSVPRFACPSCKCSVLLDPAGEHHHQVSSSQPRTCCMFTVKGPDCQTSRAAACYTYRHKAESLCQQF